MAKKSDNAKGSAVATAILVLEKVTPGALRFKEVDDTGADKRNDAEGALFGTVYARKAALAAFGRVPKKITVTLSVDE